MKIFADDVKLYSCIDNISSVDALLHLIRNSVRWSTIWQLKLSTSKCNVLTLGSIQCNNWYSIRDILLPTIDNITGLGVIMDSRMTFKLYIDVSVDAHNSGRQWYYDVSIRETLIYWSGLSIVMFGPSLSIAHRFGRHI